MAAVFFACNLTTDVDELESSYKTFPVDEKGTWFVGTEADDAFGACRVYSVPPVCKSRK